MHVATAERKNSLLTGRNLQQNQAQCERPSATTDWGFERTEQRHKENKEALIQEYVLWEGKVNVSRRKCDSSNTMIRGHNLSYFIDANGPKLCSETQSMEIVNHIKLSENKIQ
ncbi:hypothetical protein ATANTOWER_012022 [Ataeniobius toweri]|uniref:Uncharacterized protein n=1 Tax=Ataeniobius toweri TaxID=208326 RepID=A0ABU7BPR8_9TELE|nr:hypothetical protein [Ataeniobius toweri]